jgi:lactate permease
MTNELPFTMLHWSLAVFPMVLLLILLIFQRWKAAEAGAMGMLCTLIIAALAFKTPTVDLAVASAKGAWDSVYILYVIWPALLLYHIGKNSGAFDTLGRDIIKFSRNEVFLVLGFGWVFASFFQGIAGFGTPVAVAAPLLVAIGVRPLHAVAITLIGHAWANMFGTIAVSWIATSQVVTFDDPSATAIQTALLLWIPNLSAGFMIAWIFGRGPAIRHAWPFILIISAIQGGGQLLLSDVNAIICNFVPGTIALVALYPLSRWRRYHEPAEGITDRPAMRDRDEATEQGKEDAKPVMSIGMALFPYAILALISIPLLTIPPLTRLISSVDWGLPFPEVTTGFGVTRPAADPYSPLRPFNHPGFFLLITTIITWAVFKSKGYFAEWARRAEVPSIWPELVKGAVPTSVAVTSFLIMSRVLDHSGQTEVLALGIQAATPALVFAFFSNGIGIFGAFMTSSNTASNVLFAKLQSTIAELEGLPQSAIIAAQSTGGAIGNAVAPANAVLGTSTTGIVGREGDVLRMTIPWTLAVAGLTGIATVILSWVA